MDEASRRVGIIMGSQSDWETMQAAADTLTRLNIAHEVRVISAHRTPDLLFEYAAAARGRSTHCAVDVHDPEKWEPVFGKDHAPARS